MVHGQMDKRIESCDDKMFEGMSLLKVTELASAKLEVFDDKRKLRSARCMVRGMLHTACGIFCGIQSELDRLSTDIRHLGVTTSADESAGVRHEHQRHQNSWEAFGCRSRYL